MKITRYEQSCMLLELDGTRILIDPGARPFAENRSVEDLGDINAIFFTHEHADHFDKDIAEKYSSQMPVYVNESTSKQMAGSPKIIKDGDTVSVGGFQVQARELPHCLMPDGSEGPQNTGYLVNNEFFHPGDGIELPGLKVKYLALPIIGPDVSPKDAFMFVRDTGAEKAIAIHYDVFGVNAEIYKGFSKRYNQPFEILTLTVGESTEL
ncbi:MAG TPA: MBL fold metallo-hydrolase [Candidatus Saccharimonadales bacterium]|nr:MBL fold metallo-hydrolase [Candidatus Saccharimonadales bacterium]